MPKLELKPRTYIILAIIIALIIVVHLYLAVWVKHYVNKKMADLNGYSGSIEKIEIHLWRGAYKIDGLNIYKELGGLKKPFFSTETMDISVDWRALLKGAIVAEITFNKPKINFAKTQTGENAGWGDFIDSLAPFEINRLNVKKGKLSYIDYSAEPDVNLFIDNVNAQVTNLNNIDHKSNALPSTLRVTGKSIGNGNLTVNGSMNILTDIPSFDLDLKLTKAKLTAFNDFIHDAAGITFEEGNIGIFCELASTKGEVKGYVKPILTHVRIIDIKKDKNPFNLIWESLVSVFMEAFKNQHKDQFAMRIPIEGKLENPKEDSWRGFLSIFSNAFKHAFKRNVDGTISYKDILVEART